MGKHQSETGDQRGAEEMMSPKLMVSVMLLAAALAGGFGRTRTKETTPARCSMYSPCAAPSEDPLKP